MEGRAKESEPLPAEGQEDPWGRNLSPVSFLRVTPAEVRGRGQRAEGGVRKAAGHPGWEDGLGRMYGFKVSIQSLKLCDRVKKLNINTSWKRKRAQILQETLF